MSSLADAFKVLNELKAAGVVGDYAVAGAMAWVFRTEPVATFDLEVLVTLDPPATGMVSLESIYRWAEQRGYSLQAEHILIEGMPTQIVPSPDALADERSLPQPNWTIRAPRPSWTARV